MVASGRSSVEAGAIIGIGPRTVEVHWMNIQLKLCMMTSDREFGAFAARMEPLKQPPTTTKPQLIRDLVVPAAPTRGRQRYARYGNNRETQK